MFFQKVKVLLTALPTKGAAVVALLTTFVTEVVPHLPGSWQVKATAVVGAVATVITTLVAVVSRVTPILYPEDKGLLPPEPVFPEEGPDDWDKYVQELGL